MTCVICMDEIDFNDEKTYTLEQCGHVYHANCIVRNIQTGNICCPQCRKLPPFIVDVEDCEDTRIDSIAEYNLEKKKKFFESAVKLSKTSSSKELKKLVNQYEKEKEKIKNIKKNNSKVNKHYKELRKQTKMIIKEEKDYIKKIIKETSIKIKKIKTEYIKENEVGKYKYYDLEKIRNLYDKISEMAGYSAVDY